MDASTKCEHRLFSDSPMWAGATPWVSGKEPSGLRSWPRDCLKTVQRRSDRGCAWIEEHKAAHVAVFAFSTVAFHSVMQSCAALFLTRLGVRLCFQMRRAAFMRSYADLTPGSENQALLFLLVWWEPTVCSKAISRVDSKSLYAVSMVV